MIQAIKVPEIGENVESGVVVAVHIKVGDTIAVDDTVIELETDKALVEIPSPLNGRVTDVLAEPGAQMKVGDVIARVELAGDDSATREKPDTEAQPPSQTSEDAQDTHRQLPENAATGEVKPDRPPVPAAPSIRRLARELGVDIYDVRGSGPGGRITETDVKTHVRRGQPDASGVDSSNATSDKPVLPEANRWGEVDLQEMDTVRRLTAKRTSASWTTIPHVTQFDETDITEVVAFIEKHRRKAEHAAAGVTLTAILTWICARALKHFPRFNASIDVAANRIAIKRYVHIGIATDTPRGLLVPVIRDAEKKSIGELAEAIDDLVSRARSKKIHSDEMEGGTFTISNQGGIGGTGFTPIVLWPQVAILGVSRSAVKPVYIGDRFEPRTILPLSLSYDHRNIDGADAARFLRWICQGLEQPLTLFLD
jgi:pyruvate dehydrogenase E2 component (dihydrolipoamide acetyltransferase)